MKYYFSSYKVGNEPEKLRSLLLPEHTKAAYISNAFDTVTNMEVRRAHEEEDRKQLSDLGLEVEDLDLRDYFGKSDELRKKLGSYDLIWVSGGNVFVLRQAMSLSGFDDALHDLSKSDKVYGGYSAAVCVLSPTLKGYHIVDDAQAFPYEGQTETMWEGLGIIGWQFAPHFNSDHSESDDINKEIAYYEEHNLPYKALADGDVIIIDT